MGSGKALRFVKCIGVHPELLNMPRSEFSVLLAKTKARHKVHQAAFGEPES
jgi:hypothetical protein